MSGGAVPRVLVDVSQYADEPATTGIQRVLSQIALQWPDQRLEGRFGVVEGDRCSTGPLAAFASLVCGGFAGRAGALSSEEAREALAQSADADVPLDELEGEFSAYLLPEPSWRRDSLALASRLRGSGSVVPFFLCYDALPLTHPQYFARRADYAGNVTRYFRALARADNVAFISESARQEFEGRVSRRPLANATVVRPGADGLPRERREPPARPTFVVVGTVEPRKGHRLVVDTFERLWDAGRDYALVLVGRPGWEEPEFLTRLDALARNRDLGWIRDPDDGVLATTLARASGLLFLSESEGYGLPLLEALAARCPLITAGTPPALEGLPAAGQIRLHDVSAASVADAVDALADPPENAARRRELHALELPSWSGFVGELEAWMSATLAERHAA